MHVMNYSQGDEEVCMRSMVQRCDTRLGFTATKIGCSLNRPQLWEQIPLLALEMERQAQRLTVRPRSQAVRYLCMWPLISM